MKEALKTAYERELVLLKERAAAFAQDYPGMADRLGGLLEENLDPSIAGLLEGSAFLAARVQLNIDQQFRTFSTELLEQICPDMTAPLPCAMMVQGTAPGKADDLKDGRRLEIGDSIEGMFSEASRRVACRFRLAEPLEFWPIKIATSEYYSTPTLISGLGLDGVAADRSGAGTTAAGLSITLEATAKGGIDALKLSHLPIHFTGPIREAGALYEQIFANCWRVSLRWEDKMGTPVFRRLPREAVEQIGFDSDAPLFGRDERQFPGASTLLEYFAYPRKFLGMRLTGLDKHLRGIPQRKVQVIFEFEKAHSHLSTHFDPQNLRLFCAPVVNLFEEEAKPITLDQKHHRYLVSPNRSPATHYEVHRVTRVRAQYDGMRDKVPADPLYALPSGNKPARQTLYYTTERQRRSLSPQERRMGGTRHRYEGTETWITFYEPPTETPAGLLFVSTLCSNRHLPEVLPLAEGTYHLIDDRTVKFKCVCTPSNPRDAVAELESDAPHRMQAGDNYWRLISFLSLSYRGFLGTDSKGNVDAIREVLRLFSDVSDQLTEAQIVALTDIASQPITRTIKRPDGYHPTRGLEITLTFDESKMDTATIISLGAVLDRFLADYAAVNTFTQCVLANSKGQRIKQWPPRGGSGPLL